MVLLGVYRTGVRPWHLTLLSLAANGVGGVLILRGLYLAAAVALVVAGILDVLDGGVARLRGEESRTGALLDSSVDRVSDAVVFGALFVHLAVGGRNLEAALALAALVVALLVSDLRAQAEAGGASMTEGLFQRLERYVALVIGLAVPAALLPVLALLAVLGLLTVVQRLVVGWRRLPPGAR